MTADPTSPNPPPPADWLETLSEEQLVDLAERCLRIARRKAAEDERRED